MTDAIANALTAARRELATVRTTEAELRATGRYTEDGLRKALQQPRALALTKLHQLNLTYVQPGLRRRINALRPSLPQVSEHEAAALLDLWRQSDSSDRTRMRGEALRDAKLAAVLVSAHPRLTGLGDESSRLIIEAHCTDRDLAAHRTAVKAKQRAEAVHSEFREIARAVVGGGAYAD